MPIQKLFFGLAAALATATALAQPTSTRDFFLRMTTDTPSVLVDYCAATYPAGADELRAEYASFKRKAVLAVETVVKAMPERIGADEVAQGERMMAELGQRQLAEVRKLDPSAYCPWLVNSLRSTTAESFEARVQAAYERYSRLGASEPKSKAQR